MAERPEPYGFSRECKLKNEQKYDPILELEARLWIEQVIGERLHDSKEALGLENFYAIMKDGVVLCKLMNALKPELKVRFTENKSPFKMMENISNFITAAREYGVSSYDLFQTVDLYEGENMVQVIMAIYALGRTAQKNNFRGPVLGKKEATANRRTFTDEQLKAGETIMPQQAGFSGGANQHGINFGRGRDILSHAENERAMDAPRRKQNSLLCCVKTQQK